jgi:hypothetical protein
MIFISLERSLQLQYMDMRNPAELWKAIRKDYIGELQKSQIWIRRKAEGLRQCQGLFAAFLGAYR